LIVESVKYGCKEKTQRLRRFKYTQSDVKRE
jgi:hypothetical protein